MNTLLVFLVLLALAAFYATLPGVRACTVPLLAVCSGMVFCSVAGMAGLLVPGAWAFTAAGLGLGAFAALRHRARLLEKLASPGFLLVAGLGALLLVYFAVRQPLFSEWDEFVLWGTASKLMRQNGALYTTADIGWFWTATQSPGLMVLGWLAQFFGAPFAAWKVYWAYDLLLLSCAAALLGAVPASQPGGGMRRFRLWVPLAVCGLLAPFVFNVFYHTIALNTTYLSAYGDLPAGMLAGAAMAVYFGGAARGEPLRTSAAAPAGAALARGRALAAWWQPALVLAALGLVKENTLPVALVAAGVMAADTLFFAGKQTPVWRRLAAGLGWFAATLAPFALWKQHVNAVVALNTSPGGGETNISTLQAAGQALGQLLGFAPRSEGFLQVGQNLIARFLGRIVVDGQVAEGSYNVSMLGTGLATLLLLAAVFVLATVLAPARRQRLRIALAGVLLLLGFAGYQFSLLVFYGFIYHARDSFEIVDYGRYLATYFTAWLLPGLVLLVQGAFARPVAANNAPRAEATHPANPTGRQKLAAAAMLALCVGLCLRFATLVRPGYSVLDWPDSAYAAQHRRQSEADALLAALPPGARLFFVCQGGDGQEWFEYSYYLLPTVLDYSVTGGRSFWPHMAEDDFGQTLASLQTHLADTGCDYIYVYSSDEVFSQNFGGLFADRLAGWDGTPTLYQKGDDALYRPILQIAHQAGAG